MALQTLEEFEFILDMGEFQAKRYLEALIKLDRDLFAIIHESIENEDFLEELRDERHNGYPLYPELEFET